MGAKLKTHTWDGANDGTGRPTRKVATFHPTLSRHGLACGEDLESRGTH